MNSIQGVVVGILVLALIGTAIAKPELATRSLTALGDGFAWAVKAVTVRG